MLTFLLDLTTYGASSASSCYWKRVGKYGLFGLITFQIHREALTGSQHVIEKCSEHPFIVSHHMSTTYHRRCTTNSHGFDHLFALLYISLTLFFHHKHQLESSYSHTVYECHHFVILKALEEDDNSHTLIVRNNWWTPGRSAKTNRLLCLCYGRFRQPKNAFLKSLK